MTRIRLFGRASRLLGLCVVLSMLTPLKAQVPYPCPYWVDAYEHYDIWNAQNTRLFSFYVRQMTRSFIIGPPSFASYTPDGSPLRDITGTHQWVFARIHATCHTIFDPNIPGNVLYVVGIGRDGWADPIGGGFDDCPQVEIYDPEECENDDGGWDGGGDGGGGGGDPPPSGGGGGGGGEVEFRCGLVYRDEAGNEWWTCWRAN